MINNSKFWAISLLSFLILAWSAKAELSPTPTGSPSPTPTAKPGKSWRRSAASEPRAASSEVIEVIIEKPGQEPVHEYISPRRDYDPEHKSLNYSLLSETYRQMYYQAFGVWPTTPSPPPTAIPTATPVPSPTSGGAATPTARTVALNSQTDASSLRSATSIKPLRGSSWEEEIIVVSPDGRETRTYNYPDRDYKPEHKSLNYSLLSEAYRQFYYQAFGVWPTTPTPSPVLTTPTPEGYKTPAATPSAIPSSTPNYCAGREPLRLRWVSNSTQLSQPRSSQQKGWVYLLQTSDGKDTFGGLYDSENQWSTVEFFNEDRPTLLKLIQKNSVKVNIDQGDTLALWYNDSEGVQKQISIILPEIDQALSGELTYYIGSDGMIFDDIELCRPVLTTPSCTPEGFLTPSPTLTPTPENYKTPLPTVTPTPDYCGGKQPLRIAYIHDLSIVSPRSSLELGWSFEFTTAGIDGRPAGEIYDNQNNFISAGTLYDQVPIKFTLQGSDISILNGDLIRMSYKETEFGPLQNVDVMLPIDGGSGQFGPYYIASTGAIYSDADLCSVIKGTPSPTLTPVPTASALTPTVAPATPTPIITATPVPTSSPLAGARQTDPTPESGQLMSLPSPSPEPFELLAVLEGGESWMDGVWADTSLILGANEDGSIYVWNRETFDFRARLSFPNTGRMLAVTADSTYLYGASDDGNIYLWRRADFSRVISLRGDTSIGDPVESLASFGGILYAGTTGRRIYRWRVSDLSPLSELKVSSGWITGVMVDPSRIYGATGGSEYSLYIWDRDGVPLAELSGAESDLNGVWVDSKRIILPSSDSNLYVWSYDFDPIKIIKDCRDQVTGAASSRGFLYASCHDGALYAWELEDFRLARRLTDAPGSLQALAVQGSEIFAACRDGNIYCWYAPVFEDVPDYGATPTPTPYYRGNWEPPRYPTPSDRTWSEENSSQKAGVAEENVIEPPYTPEPYDAAKKTLDYGLLEETYKQTAWEWFGIVLTTPTPAPSATPPPTPIPTPTSSGGSGTGKVAINEINWGGLSSNSEGYWVELYNYGDEDESLGSWTLEYDSGTTVWTITFSTYNLKASNFYVASNSSCPNNSKVFSSLKLDPAGGTLTLRDASGNKIDQVDCSSSWFYGGLGISMERKDPSSSSSSSSNWNAAPGSAAYSCTTVNYGTPFAQNSSAVSGSGIRAMFIPSITLQEYADWIDFNTGNYFKLYPGDLGEDDPRFALYDYLPNTAFIYLVAGYQPSAEYFRANLLELVRDSSFSWGGAKTCRGIADIAESYLAMAASGVFSAEEMEEIENKFVELALKNRGAVGTTNYSQGSICGLNAVVGYIVGGDTGQEMIKWSNQLLSYDDTWTLPENSRYWQGLFIREMLRVALYTNQMEIPQLDDEKVAWRENFATQIAWIIQNFPPNGFMPAWGEDYRQNFTDRFLEVLAVATSVLDDGVPQHSALARQAKWLLQQAFGYGREHEVGPFGQSEYGYPATQMGPFATFCNPVYLYWFLNEDLFPATPDSQDIGSRLLERPMMPSGSLEGVYDRKLDDLKVFPDKVIHRDGYGDEAIFLMLDLGAPAAGSDPGRYGFGNDVLSISIGSEEFLSGVTMNYANPSYLLHNLSSIPGRYGAVKVLDWEDNSDYSRSRTELKGREGTWVREVTLHKNEDRRLEVIDTLSGKGIVRWHLGGEYRWLDQGMVLSNKGTQVEVTWSGADHVGHKSYLTWGEDLPEDRWTKSQASDQEIQLQLGGPGRIITIFRPLGEQDRDLVPESPYQEEAEPTPLPVD